MWMQLDGKWVNSKAIDFIDFAKKRDRKTATVYLGGAIITVSEAAEVEKLDAFVQRNQSD